MHKINALVADLMRSQAANKIAAKNFQRQWNTAVRDTNRGLISLIKALRKAE